MKSVRLDPVLEGRLEEAARVTGQPVSAIIRLAIEERCQAILGDRLDLRLADIIGSVDSGGGNSRSTGEAFRAILDKKRSRRS